MGGLIAEGMTFLQALICGMVVYSAYNCIRKIRRIIPHNLLAISIEDIFFWIGTTIYLFVQIYYTSNGRIRWYFVLGVVFGMLFLIRIQRRVEKITKKDKIRRKY